MSQLKFSCHIKISTQKMKIIPFPLSNANTKQTNNNNQINKLSNQDLDVFSQG